MTIRVRTALGTAFLVVSLVEPPFAQRQAFDTASVLVNQEPGRPGTVGTTMTVSPSGIAFSEVSLMNCIVAAYRVTGYQIKGPAWLRTEWYDIVARSAGPASRDQLMAMLQTLLADRFKLALHREQEDMRVYALVVDKGGARLQPSGDQNGEQTVAGVAGGWAFKSATMADLADKLSKQGPIGVPVVDQTNLRGRFDFTVSLIPKKNPNDASTTDSKRTIRDGGPTTYVDALAELGLRLESLRLPMEVLVVDHAERVPTPN